MRSGASLLLAWSAASRAVAADESVVMPVTINQVAKGDFLVVLRGDDILLRLRDLESAGVHGLGGTRATINGQTFVSLASLRPDVSFALDRSSITLSLTVPPRDLGATVLNMGIGRPPGIVYSRDKSAFVNYTVSWQDFQRVSGFAETGLNLGGKLLYSSVSRNADGTFVRGQTNLTIDRRAQLQQIVLGDDFANTGELGGGLFVAGLSLSRDYGLDPYFIPYPTMAFGGAVTTPSTAEIYVNGNLVGREQLPPGQFDLTNLQLPTGSGTVQVLIRDAFGQERVLANPFYASTQLLARGNQEYGYTVGFRRENVSTASGDYGSPVFLGHHRFGWTDSATPEARLEVGKGLVSGGGGVALRLPVGELSCDVAASRDHTVSGEAASLSYRYVGRPLSFGLVLRHQSRGYATSGLEASQDRSLRDVNVFMGEQVIPGLGVTAQYIASQMRDTPSNRTASLIANLTLRRAGSLYLSAGRVSIGGRTGNQALVGYSYTLTPRSLASVSYARQEGIDTTTANVQQPLPVGEGFGYQVTANNTPGMNSGRGLFQYQGRFGRYDLEVDRMAGATTKTLTVTGGVVAIGGEVLATRAVENGFALVRVPGVEGVAVSDDNQPMGRTDAGGKVLVPSLLPYYGNRLGIRDSDIPLDYEVGATEETVAPPYRGGALVTFPVRKIQSVRGRVVVAQRQRDVVPSFGQMTLSVTGTAVTSPLGEDGAFDFENIGPGDFKAVVEFAGGSCTFTLHVPVSRSQIVDLGVVRCPALELQGGGA